MYSAKEMGPSRWIRSMINCWRGLVVILPIAKIHHQQIQGHIRGHAAAFQSGIGSKQLTIGPLQLRLTELSYVAQCFCGHKACHPRSSDDLRDTQTSTTHFFDEQ